MAASPSVKTDEFTDLQDEFSDVSDYSNEFTDLSNEFEDVAAPSGYREKVQDYVPPFLKNQNPAYFIAEKLMPPEKTIEELQDMSVEERMQYAQDLVSAREAAMGGENVNQFLSSLTFGLSEHLNLFKPKGEVSGLPGSLAGMVAPLELIYQALGRPLVNLAMKAPQYQKSLASLARMTGMGLSGATYESAKDVVESGELPTAQDALKYGASWFLLDGAFQAAGKLFEFVGKLVKYSEATGTPQKKILNELIDEVKTEGINAEETPDIAAEAIDFELERKIDSLPQNESTIEKPIVKEGEQPNITIDEFKDIEPKAPLEAIEEPKTSLKQDLKGLNLPATAKITSSPANKFEAKPSKKASPTSPFHVEIPKELQGKPSEFIVSRYVQHRPESRSLEGVKFKSVMKELDRQLLNKYKPLHDLGEGVLSSLDHPGKLADTMKGYTGRLESIFKTATYDLEEMVANGPGLQVIFNPKRIKELTGKATLDRAAFDNYLAAKSSLERQKSGQLNPIPTEAAKHYIAENKKFEPLAKDLNTFTKNSLSNLRKSGMISEDAESAMNELYKEHAPLYRVFPKEKSLMELLKEKAVGPRESGVSSSRSLQPSQPVKKAKGSLRQIISPTESIIKNTIAFEEAISKNNVMKAAGKQVHESLGGQIEKLGPKKFSKQELQDMLGDSFEVTDANYASLNQAANIGRVTEIDPHKITWFEDGVRHQISAPKEIIEAIRGMTPSQANAFIKLASGWRNLFSKGIVLEPGTMTRISLLSNVVSTLQSRYPATPLKLLDIPYNLFYETPRMLFKIMKKDALYQDFLQSGAAQVMMQGLDRQMLESMADTYFNAARAKTPLLVESVTAPIKAAKAVVKGLEKISNVLGDAERMIEFEKSYNAAIKDGLTRKEALAQAAYDAYEVSIPYGREGQAQWLQSIYQIVPFSRTITNSTVSFVKALKQPENIAAATAYLTIPTIALYLKNRNDPRYQAIPQKDRNKNIYYWETNDPNEKPKRLGKFWQWGFLFQTIPEHAVEFMIQKDPKALKSLMESFEYEFSPFTFLSLGSAFTEQGFDLAKVFEGRFVKIPEKMKRLEAELQITNNTSEMAKKLGNALNVSPLYVDFIINQTGGGLGTDAVRLADEVAYSMGWSVDRRDQKFPENMIFYRSFLGSGPSTRSEHLSRFYEYVDKFDTMKQSAAEYRKRGEDDKADKIMEGYQDLSKKRKRIGNLFKMIESIRGEVSNTSELKEGKRKQLQKLYQEMTDLAKQYVEDIEE